MNNLTAQNPSSIREMFSVISKRYDLVNSILSLGIHHRWKKKLIQASGVQSGNRVLDCATGTGDLAFLFESALKGTGQVTGGDFCESMLEIAKDKAKKRNSKAQFESSDVMNLNYPDATFDLASISFGIRNVQDVQKALSELGRVVKPKGKVLVLEFGQPQSPLIAALYKVYSQAILPYIGGWVSGRLDAYRYLQSSSSQFPCGAEFLKIATSTHYFGKMQAIPLQSGIAFLYILDRL